MTMPAQAASPGSRVAPSGHRSAVATAIVLATSPGASGGPAALMAWEGGTPLSRLLEQLRSLGVADIRVVARPDAVQDVREAAEPLAPGVRTSPSRAADLRAIAAIARDGAGTMVVLPAEIITHREALAALFKNPRVVTGILAGGDYPRRYAYRIRAVRGRVISAASPYHLVHRPTSVFLGVVKVAEADRATLADVAERLAELADAPPPDWKPELERKGEMWRRGLWRVRRADPRHEDEIAADEHEDGDLADDADLVEDEPIPGGATLEPEDEARARERVLAAEQDVTSLLVVGLVRAGVHVGTSRLRGLYWARPLAPETVDLAARRLQEYDEDRIVLNAAVKGQDGFFTTYFVSPYSRYIARWAAQRGLTPNQVTTASVVIGLLAAAGFATGERWGLVAGAVLLQVSFTADCVDGQLARYTRNFSKFGAWLDSIFDRTKEYAVFAGLAVGASRVGEPAWLLACAALVLQTVRHSADFSFGNERNKRIADVEQPPLEQVADAAGAAARRAQARARGSAPAPPTQNPPSPARRMLRLWLRIDGLPGGRNVKKMLAFPIGERFALISITAALFTPRVTLIAVLAWGGLAATYTLTGRILRSIAR